MSNQYINQCWFVVNWFPGNKLLSFSEYLKLALKKTTTVAQITYVSSVCSIVYSGADQRKHQSLASLAFVSIIQRWQMDSLQKGPVTPKMFPFDDVIVITKTQCFWCRYELIVETGIWILTKTQKVRYILPVPIDSINGLLGLDEDQKNVFIYCQFQLNISTTNCV